MCGRALTMRSKMGGKPGHLIVIDEVHGGEPPRHNVQIVFTQIAWPCAENRMPSVPIPSSAACNTRILPRARVRMTELLRTPAVSGV